jgi:phospholipase/carboxylesterase
MPAWYDIRELSLRRDVDQRGVRESEAAVHKLIAREGERGVPPGRIVLAGFSQGGAVALYTALRFPQRLAGILALSTYLLGEESLVAERADANRETPVFQAHGELDPMVPLQAGEMARDRLRALGQPHEWRTFAMGHEVCPDEIAAVGEWLNTTLSAG